MGGMNACYVMYRCTPGSARRSRGSTARTNQRKPYRLVGLLALPTKSRPDRALNGRRAASAKAGSYAYILLARTQTHAHTHIAACACLHAPCHACMHHAMPARTMPSFHAKPSHAACDGTSHLGKDMSPRCEARGVHGAARVQSAQYGGRVGGRDGKHVVSVVVVRQLLHLVRCEGGGKG